MSPASMRADHGGHDIHHAGPIARFIQVSAVPKYLHLGLKRVVCIHWGPTKAIQFTSIQSHIHVGHGGQRARIQWVQHVARRR
jgi:hypothetical protein